MTRKKKQIAVIDFETDPFLFGRIPYPFAAGFYDGVQMVTFWGSNCVESLVDFINDLDDNYIIYAHNGGKFDFHFLLPYLEENIKIINGRIAECFIGEQTLRDSLLILPLALKNHAKTEIDYSKFEVGEREKHRYEITYYLKDDCIYLFEWVSKFIDRFGINLTLPGACFKYAKKHFQYEIEKTDNDYDLHFRSFYYGGRVEAIQSGVIPGPLKYYDITSAYPFAMLSEHPKGNDFIQLKKLPKKAGCWFAEIDAVSRGCLPYREEGQKMQYFRDDKIRKYFATGWEIIAGIETGTLSIVETHAVYKHCFTSNYEEYVNYFFEEKANAKKNGDIDTETFSKLFLNAFYGKKGQDSRLFHDYIIREFGSDESDGFTWDCDFGNFELHKRKSKDDDDCEFYNVATAASITGFVRAFLWRSICASRNPVYCDTDSLLCGSMGAMVEKDSSKLGAWKLEADITTAYIGGRKFYLLECADGKTKQATKGFRATPDQLRKSIEQGTLIEYKKDAPAFNLKYGAGFIERDIYPENCNQKIKKIRDKADRFVLKDNEWSFKFKKKKITDKR